MNKYTYISRCLSFMQNLLHSDSDPDSTRSGTGFNKSRIRIIANVHNYIHIFYNSIFIYYIYILLAITIPTSLLQYKIVHTCVHCTSWDCYYLWFIPD